MQKASRSRVDLYLAICASYEMVKDLLAASLLRQNSITAFFQLSVILSVAEHQDDVIVAPLLNKSEHSSARDPIEDLSLREYPAKPQLADNSNQPCN